MRFLKKVEAAFTVTAGKAEQAAFDKWLEAKGGSFGKKSQSGWTEGKEAWSYNTIIAKIKGKTLYVNSTKYSSTTSRLTQYLRMKGKEAGFKVEEREEKFFGTSMPEKLDMGANKGKKGANLRAVG